MTLYVLKSKYSTFLRYDCRYAFVDKLKAENYLEKSGLKNRLYIGEFEVNKLAKKYIMIQYKPYQSFLYSSIGEFFKSDFFKIFLEKDFSMIFKKNNKIIYKLKVWMFIKKIKGQELKKIRCRYGTKLIRALEIRLVN